MKLDDILKERTADSQLSILQGTIMIRKAVTSVVAAAVLSSATVVPAQAVSMERLDGNCRISLTHTEMKATGMYNPIFLSPEEAAKFLPEFNETGAALPAEIERVKSDSTLDSERKESRLKTLEVQFATYQEMAKMMESCANPDSGETRQPSDLGSSETGILALIAGVAGAIFGAIAAVIISLPQIRQFFPGA